MKNKDLDMDLEKDFSDVQKKVDEATAALKEANELAAAHGEKLSRLEWMHSNTEQDSDTCLNFYPLIDELDKAGWRTSSMNC